MSREGWPWFSYTWRSSDFCHTKLQVIPGLWKILRPLSMWVLNSLTRFISWFVFSLGKTWPIQTRMSIHYLVLMIFGSNDGNDGVVDLLGWGVYLGVWLAVSSAAATLFRRLQPGVTHLRGWNCRDFLIFLTVILTPDWNHKIERHWKLSPQTLSSGLLKNLRLRSTFANTAFFPWFLEVSICLRALCECGILLWWHVPKAHQPVSICEPLKTYDIHTWIVWIRYPSCGSSWRCQGCSCIFTSAVEIVLFLGLCGCLGKGQGRHKMITDH